MTEQNFGKVFGTGGMAAHPGPVDSYVSLTFAPANVAVASQLIGGGIRAVYLSDDTNEREFAVYDGGGAPAGRLTIYTVALGNGTGSASISLQSTTYAAPTEDATHAGFSYLGMKKVSAAMYYVYYMINRDRSDATPYHRVRRIEIVPGGSFTDTLMQSYTIDGTSFIGVREMTIGRKVYYGLANGTPLGDLNCVSFSIAIYCLDMDTGGISTYATWDSGGTAGHPMDTDVGDANPLALAHTMGALVWTVHYVDRSLLGFTDTAYVVINGVATAVYTITDTVFPFADPGLIANGQAHSRNYNTRDYILDWRFVNGSITNQYFASYNGGAPISYLALPDIKTPTTVFISDHTFPAVAPILGIDWWVNPATGLATSKVVIDGVTEGDIRTVFPTLDEITGSIYMAVKRNGSNALLAIQKDTGVIGQEIAVAVATSTRAGFNHGNFFVFPNTSEVVRYLGDNVEPHDPNGVQMVAEFN